MVFVSDNYSRLITAYKTNFVTCVSMRRSYKHKDTTNTHKGITKKIINTAISIKKIKIKNRKLQKHHKHKNPNKPDNPNKPIKPHEHSKCNKHDNHRLTRGGKNCWNSLSYLCVNTYAQQKQKPMSINKWAQNHIKHTKKH